jgi:tetratricopeptide (TPR) repeat protein
MRYFFLPIPIWLILIFSFYQTFGQATQTGFVKEISSHNKGLAGVKIHFEGAPITASDKGGNFKLEFVRNRPGDVIEKISIYKASYIVINETEVIDPVLSSKKTLKIVMSLEVNFQANKKKYYNIFDSNNRAYYSNNIANAARIQDSSRRFMEFDKITREFDVKSRVSEQAADVIARIDLDDVSKELRQVIHVINTGDVDSALQLLQELKLIERIDSLLHEKRDLDQRIKATVSATRLQGQFYFFLKDLKNGMQAYDKILEIKPTDIQIILEYVGFLNLFGLTKKSLSVMKVNLNMSQNEVARVRLLDEIAETYRQIGIIDSVREYYKSALRNMSALAQIPVYEHTKEEVQLLNDFGIFLNDIGRPDSAIMFLDQALDKLQRLTLVSDYWDNSLRSSIHANLGVAFHIKEEYRLAITQLENSIQFYERLKIYDTTKFVAEIARVNNRIGNIYEENGRNTDALVHYNRALSTFRYLSKNDCLRHCESVAMLLDNIGNLYLDLNPSVALKYYNESYALRSKETGFRSLEMLNHFAGLLANRGAAYYKTYQSDSAIADAEGAISIRENLYSTSPEKYASDYSLALHTGAPIIFERFPERGIQLFNRSYQIRKKLLVEGNIHQLFYFINTANVFSSFLFKSERKNEAINVMDESMNIFRGIYQSDSTFYWERYLRGLSMYINTYVDMLKIKSDDNIKTRAIGLLNEADRIMGWVNPLLIDDELRSNFRMLRSIISR